MSASPGSLVGSVTRRLGRLLRSAAFACFLLATTNTFAGGSGEKVLIERLDVRGDSYTLVVVPEKSEVPDPYMGTCAHFEVRGTYRRLKGEYFWLPVSISREEHLKALAYLQHAFETKQPLYFGWIGTGFVVIDPANPCIVKSRALSVLEDKARTKWVVSYHDRF